MRRWYLIFLGSSPEGRPRGSLGRRGAAGGREEVLIMRRMGVALAILGALLVAGPAFGTVFVIGPGMLGNPGADDPSVGYSSLALDEKLVSPEAAFAPGGAGVPLRPWEEPWYQLNQMPGT